MAEKRMFTKKITVSDAFLNMPLSTQALYFHLNMAADDEGFVNSPKKIQRMIGASDDDFKLLLAKNFVIAFESGVIVIKHWKMHNCIQRDRFHATDYQEERSMLEVKKNGAYTIPVYGMETECIQNGNADKNRLEENRLDKNREEENSTSKEVRHKHGEYGHVLLTDKQYQKLIADFGEEATGKAIKKVDEYCQQYGKRYTDYNLTLRKWGYDGIKTKKSSGSSDLEEWAARKEKELNEHK
jgi:hypothetical protein